jgi:U4/U6 small nuclear ribonucleoprotein PRP3
MKRAFLDFHRVKDLTNTKNRFKVDVNAQENHLTGGVLICGAADTNLVVVEGGLVLDICF